MYNRTQTSILLLLLLAFSLPAGTPGPAVRVIHAQAPGDTVEVQLDLKAGKYAGDLSLEGLPPECVPEIQVDGRNTSVITEKSSGTISASLRIPSSAKEGIYSFDLMLDTGKEKISLYSGMLILSIPPQVEFMLPKTLNSAHAGTSISLPVMIRNTGLTPLSSPDISLKGPEGWKQEISPSFLRDLTPSQSQTFTLTVTPPAHASSGRKSLQLSITQGDNTFVETIPVEVSPFMNILWLMLFALSAALIILAIMQKKYGRR